MFGKFQLALLFLPALAMAQQHATLTVGSAAADSTKAIVRIDAKIDSGWHLYAATSPSGIALSFTTDSPAVTSIKIFQPAPKVSYDDVVQANREVYESDTSFYLELALKSAATTIPLKARYQVCSDTQCFPGRWNTEVAIPPAVASLPAIPAGYTEAKGAAKTVASTGAPVPVRDESGWGFFIVTAFGLGLASIFTPCVFPMIPLTMSYFLNRNSGGRRDSITQAVVFCLGIVVLFTAIGLAATAALGPAGVKNLGGNPWVNGFIAALFFAFALSLLGAFEITIPSSVLTRLNKSSEKGGFGGTLLMGFAFSLSSFACVGPFVGTLLAASVGGGGARPLVGMVTFATGLALPFFVLALFPGYLKRMPRSGGWLARVKVVMGFVIMAASLKYLSSADQVLHWGFLTRDRFLAAWVVLFAMAGLYLLGFLRLEGVKADAEMGLGRLLTGMAFLIFAISLLPGMFGGRLGELDAYIPEAAAGTALGSGGAASPSDSLTWLKDRYQDALTQARAEGKLVFIDFTGYACTNCHWMRANMLSRPEIAALLKNFVLVELYTDGTDAASEANSKMQVARFGTVAEPFYVIQTADEKVIATFDHLTKDPAEYLAFLQEGSGQSSPSATLGAAAAPAADLKIPKLTTLQGAPIDAAAFAGKTVVLNFWATYCVPCIQEVPIFNKIGKQYAGRVVVIGVSMDEPDTDVAGFLKKHPMDYQVAKGSPDLTTPYGLDSLPVTYVFDNSGKVTAHFVGSVKGQEDQLTAALR
ncbi:MAG TPA: cytochrome c biogenesis protein CcdA [Candidatus Limnocylindrales bacterium]|nr:cytochrome c biogenesis protein CcdA [Candidatus Limnocylindrales bacterium]